MSDYLSKLQALDRKIGDPAIHRQVREIEQIIKTVARHEVLPLAPAKLGLLPDQAEQTAEKRGKYQAVKTINHLLNSFRQYLSLRFGIWSLPNLEAAFLLKQKLRVKNALEIMAGNAYWSKALAQAGVQVTATDSSEWAKTSATGQQPMLPVQNLTAAMAIKTFPQADLILCSWAPNFGQADLKAIKAWRRYNSHSHLLFIGEEGVTNSPAFWHETNLVKNNALNQINAAFNSFDFIDEEFFEVERS